MALHPSGYRYSVNGKCSVFRSDEGMTDVGSVRGLLTYLLHGAESFLRS